MHFEQFLPLGDVFVARHFCKDAPGFDTTLVTDSRHEHFTHLHRFEETVDGYHVFRALWHGMHIVYAIDRKHNIIFLAGFRNFGEYGKFLNDKKAILRRAQNILPL